MCFFKMGGLSPISAGQCQPLRHGLPKFVIFGERVGNGPRHQARCLGFAKLALCFELHQPQFIDQHPGRQKVLHIGVFVDFDDLPLALTVLFSYMH